jgi:hypothetical protein
MATAFVALEVERTDIFARRDLSCEAGSVGNIYGIRTMRCSPSVSLPESF